MATLSHSNNLHFRDGTQGARVPVANGVTILAGTFITITGGEIVKATSSSVYLGFALTSATGSTAKKCSINYLNVEEGDQFIIPTATGTQPVVGQFYTLNGENVLGSGSASPTANRINFLYDGRVFVARSY